jgi:DNA-binding NarL/FixJ family response regulator
VANLKSIRLLLVEDDIDDEELLREAIGEIIEAPNWPNWHSCELLAAGTLNEALEFLALRPFDAVLLNLSLPDGESLLKTFAQVRDKAGAAPVIVLADKPDEGLAHTLLRDGAQDVILKSELDCDVLARSVRYAMERQRRANAVAATSFFDELTGLYNARGFTAVAGRDISLAKLRGDSLLITCIEIELQEENAVDLGLLRTSELLREAFGEYAVVGRVAPHQFAVLSSLLTENGAEQVATALEQDLDGLPVHVRAGSVTYCRDHPGGVLELLCEAQSRLTAKAAMLAH